MNNTPVIATERPMTLPGFTLTSKGLLAIGTPTFNQWLDCGDFLFRTEKAVHWYIGDWLNYGEWAYGEKYSQAIDATDGRYSYGTLANDAWVAGRIEVSRRRENLSFAHHQEVAALPPEQQDQWLDTAETNHLPVNQLRQQVKSLKEPQEPITLHEYVTCPNCGNVFIKSPESISYKP